MEKRVGIIGYGSIGKEIIAATRRHEIPNARIVALFDKESTVFNSVDYDTSQLHLFSDFDEFYNSKIYSNIDIIIECASKGAVKEYGKKIIESKKDLIVLSVGAFSDEDYLRELQNLSKLNNTRILIPTGAIAGLDSIRSVKKYLNTLTIVTTKNPKSRDLGFFVVTMVKVFRYFFTLLMESRPAMAPVGINILVLFNFDKFCNSLK